MTNSGPVGIAHYFRATREWLTQCADFDASLPEPVDTEIRLITDDPQASLAGSLLASVDLQVRAAGSLVAAMPGGRPLESAHLPPPLGVAAGGLTIRRAEKGSLEILLDAYELVEAAVLAKPVQLLATLAALCSGTAQLAVFRRASPEEPEFQVPVIELDGVRLEFPGEATEVLRGARIRVRHVHADGSVTAVHVEL